VTAFCLVRWCDYFGGGGFTLRGTLLPSPCIICFVVTDWFGGGGFCEDCGVCGLSCAKLFSSFER